LYSRERRQFRFKDKHYSIIFLAPAMIALLGCTLYPMIYSLWISLTGWNLKRPETRGVFVGFRNYLDVLIGKEFWDALSVTFRFSILSVVCSLIIGTLVALLMYQGLRGNAIVRSFIISAMILAPIVVGTAWRMMYNPTGGIINYFLELIGIGAKPFLSEKATVIPALVATDVWQWSPLVMIIVLAALQGLPLEVFESSKIDGANSINTLIHITIPMIKPSILLATLIRTMDSFRTFDTIFAMTKGGPGTASQNLNIIMYNTGFESFRIGRASAMSLLSLVLITVTCTIILRLFQRNDSLV